MDTRLTDLQRALKRGHNDPRFAPTPVSGVYTCSGFDRVGPTETEIARAFGCRVEVVTKRGAPAGALDSWDLGDHTLITILYVDPPPPRPWWHFALALASLSLVAGSTVLMYYQREAEWE